MDTIQVTMFYVQGMESPCCGAPVISDGTRLYCEVCRKEVHRPKKKEKRRK